MRCNTVFLCLILVFLLQAYENGSAKLKLTNFYCESYNKSWIVVKECRLRAKSREVTLLNMTLDLLHPAHDIFIHGNLMKKANGYKPFLINIEIDACKFLKRHNHPVANLVYNIIKDSSTLNHTCPYQGQQIVRNFQPKVEQLNGLPLPTGEYMITLKYHFGRKPQVVMNFYFSYVENLI